MTDIILLTPMETAAILHVTTGTLAVWRCTKRYPLPYVPVGRKILYKAEAVRDFVESRNGVVHPESEKAKAYTPKQPKTSKPTRARSARRSRKTKAA